MSATDTTFAGIVAAFDRYAACEAVTLRGNTCQRPATRHLNLHGCEHVLLCGQHLRAWEQLVAAEMRPVCAHCGRRFASLADAYVVTPA